MHYALIIHLTYARAPHAEGGVVGLKLRRGWGNCTIVACAFFF